MEDFGIELYRYGIVFHGDQRQRREGLDREPRVLPSRLTRRVVKAVWRDGHYVETVGLERRRGGYRGRIRAFSPESVKQFGFVLANGVGPFRSLLTLTYRAKTEEWETDVQRNRRIVERSKVDLHRFLCGMRSELGAYVWVQEFQARGVIHYHVICEREVAEARVRLAWTQAIGQLRDRASFEHGAKVTLVGDQSKVRAYLGKYMGKERQKSLPPGVDRAGRWWGRSRSLKLDLVMRVVSCEKKAIESRRAESKVVRIVRGYLGRALRKRVVAELQTATEPGRRRILKRRLRRPFRGGWFTNWGGELSATLAGMIERLHQAYGVTLEVPQSVAEFTWAVDEYMDQGVRYEIRPAL